MRKLLILLLQFICKTPFSSNNNPDSPLLSSKIRCKSFTLQIYAIAEPTRVKKMLEQVNILLIMASTELHNDKEGMGVFWSD